MSYQPKSYNKFLAGAATAAVVASAVVPVATHAAEKKLTDVKEGSYYAEAVNALAEAGVIKGYEDGTFRPNNQVTRAEVAKIIAVQLGLDTENAGTANYSDAKGHWANTGGYLAAVAKAGIMNGDGNGTFRPNAPLTRAEMASIVVRAYDLQAKEGFESQFKDLNAGGAWAADAIKTLEANGYANGIAKGQFGSASNVKRADVAVFLFRVAKGEAAPTVESVSAINNIEVNEGAETVNLPKEVEVKLSNGEKAQKAVEWDKKGLDLNKPGEYTLTGDVADTDLTASVKVVVKAVDPEVTSVSSINATQVEVKFNKAVDAKTLFVDGVKGAFKAGVISFTSLDKVDAGTLTGSLSADGKTLTVTATNVLSKRYDVVVDNVKTKDEKAVAKYSKMITIEADKTAPTILGTERISASQVKVKFSEPMKAFDKVTFKYADGSDVTGVSGTIAAGANEVIFTMTDAVKENKEIVATFIGAQDQAGNLITPNPATVSFTKGAADGVAPTVSSITQTGAKTFAVKFSEELTTAPTVTIGGTAAAKVEKDSTDATVYNVTSTNVLDDAITIAISSFTDLSGEKGTDVSKVVTFTKDTVAPKVTSSNVVVDSKDNKEYLELTFDKDVELDSAKVTATGTQVKDYITTSVSPAASDLSYKNEDNKKVVRVALASFLGANDVEGASYKLDLTFSGVKSTFGVAADSAKATLTRGKDGVVSNTDIVKVTKVEQQAADNNKVEVTFDKAVDGATASTAANYKIDGAIVENVTVLPVDKDGNQIAVLNLKEGSNNFTGVRNITISGVKALGSSKAMDTYNNTVELKENIAPTVTKAVLSANDEIMLTFSEAVTDNTGLDFEVLVGGKSQAVAETVDANIGSTPSTTVKVKVKSVDSEKLSKGISLKALTDTLDITDAAGNKLFVPANIVVNN
ncbi:S-layer homology domain-containing protein [Heyndrickxia oleronia]|uniref:S-layer homology domain-containing protein n=1 Tax=Heyndrickxia oleronia TaxID=38875 RepID=UPI001B2051D1|nr:S-layer homology domain-containing protein [Heyndrickxia oleronia]GIN39970.1 S-layer protein [Heyndrickxia oleronia]